LVVQSNQTMTTAPYSLGYHSNVSNDENRGVPSISKALACFGESKSASRGVSWRHTELSDWQVRLGSDRIYSVHRAILGEGHHQSEFFLAQFRCCPQQGITDLGAVLPELCWSKFEQVLDFIYGEDIELDPKSAVLLYKTAQILLIKALAEKVVYYLEAHLTQESALSILGLSLQLSPGLEEFEAAAIYMIAREFDHYHAREFVGFSADTVARILLHHNLHALDRHVCNTVTAILRASSTRGEAAETFGKLSRFIKQVDPVDALFLLGACGRFGHEELYSECLYAVTSTDFSQLLLSDFHAAFDVEAIIDLLDKDDLIVKSEDDIFEAVLSYVRSAQVTPEQLDQLWSVCRFAHMSAEKLCYTALLTECVPQDLVKFGLERALSGESRDTMASSTSWQLIACQSETSTA